MTIPLSGMLLDGCVMAILERGDAYGYSLTQQMKAVVEISESTLYPVLRRLQRDGCLNVYDQEFQGRNRRYYGLTAQGKTSLTSCRANWLEDKSRIESLLVGGMEHE